MSQDQKKSNKQRRLAAIMFTDMVGYSALTQKNEALAIELIEEHRNILRPIFPKHGGNEVETVGDAFFVEFKSALEAVNCAIEIQKTLFDRNSKVESERKIVLRIGLHVGDVIQVGQHVHGDGVNIAARLEPLSKPGGICLSEDVARQIQNKVDIPVKNIGSEKLKNIQAPINIYRLVLPWEEKEELRDKRVFQKIKKQRFSIFAASLLLMVVAFLLIGDMISENPVDSSTNRIAVLPLINISDNSQSEYFADGMTEELISQLTKISGLNVIARTSVIKYKDTKLDIEEIGGELNVGTILRGSVRQAADKARISVRLIDVNTQEHLWTNEYDRELKDIFAIQTDIALKVANELRIQLIPEEKQQIEKMGTENVEAYRSYLLGKFHLNKRNEESIFKSLEYFKEATDLDSEYALAYVGIADCYTLIGGGGYGSLPQDLVIEKAKSAVKKALELDDTLAEAYNAQAYINFRLEWDWEEAEKNFKKTITLKPGYATAYEKYGFFLALLGRFDESLPLMLHAHELDPMSASVSTGVGRIYYFSRQQDNAILQYKKTLETNPDYVEALFALGTSYEQKKMYGEAISELNRAIKLSNARPIIVTALGSVYVKSGRREEAKSILNKIKEREKKEGISPFYGAILNAALGNMDPAMDALNQAYNEHFGLIVYINVEPLIDPFRSEPRFQQLLKKMKFE
jgi:TolB-like protein/class 3 adenylate cyclase/Tfp pilus assembly protein PilF